MRKLCVLLMIVASVIMGLGCGGDGPDEPGGAIDACLIDSTIEGCCDKTYYVSVELPAGDWYCWLTLLRSDSLVLNGESVFVPVDQETRIVDLSLQVAYCDFVPPGTYFLYALVADSEGNVYSYPKRATAQTVDTVWVPNYAGMYCEPCCTRRPAWAGIMKRNLSGADLVGASTSMWTVYGQKLCGYGTDTINAFSLAWVAVVYDTSIGYNGSVWASTGYGKFRFQGLPTIWKARFSEVQPESTWCDRKVDIANPDIPPDNEWHHFKIELNHILDRWVAYYDGEPWDTADYFWLWQVVRGDYSRFSAEILNFEDDMAGTVSNKCILSDCATKAKGGNYNTVNFRVDAEFWYSDKTEWMVDTVTYHRIEIWDVNPRP